MQNMTGDIFTLATMTAVVGMSVVIVALFILSAYMNLFKKLVNRLESGRKQAPVPQNTTKAAPSRAAAVKVLDTDKEIEKIAALAAVALHLDGASPRVAPELAAVIGTAIHLELLGRSQMAPAQRGASGHALHWGMAGRLAAHGQRTHVARRSSVAAARPG